MASAVSRCLASTARVHARGLVVRVAVAWLAIALSLLVIMPALASVFGSSRLEQAGPGRRAALQRLDRIERLVVAQLDGVRSDLLLIGATNAVRRYLAEDDADADADGVSNDLQAFAATRSWCRWTLLAVAGREPVIAERTHEKPVCGSLLEVAAGLSPGTLLLDRVSAPAGPGVRLCFALPLEAGAAGPAVLVAEGDPVVLFARLAALPVADGSPFLSDGHGRWLLEPPSPVTPLLRRAVALSSWQGPAGGRWEIAVPWPDPAPDTSSTAPVHGWTPVIAALAGLLALVVVQAGERRRRQRAWIGRAATSADQELT